MFDWKKLMLYTVIHAGWFYHVFEANLEAVPRAVTQAWSIPLKNKRGFLRVMTKVSPNSVPQAWMIKPRMTVTMYKPSCWAVFCKSGMLKIFPTIKHIIPNGEYLENEHWSYIFLKSPFAMILTWYHPKKAKSTLLIQDESWYISITYVIYDAQLRHWHHVIASSDDILKVSAIFTANQSYTVDLWRLHYRYLKVNLYQAEFEPGNIQKGVRSKCFSSQQIRSMNTENTFQKNRQEVQKFSPNQDLFYSIFANQMYEKYRK